MTWGEGGNRVKEQGKATATGNGTGCLPRRTVEDSTEPFCFVTKKEGVVNGSFLWLQIKCLKLFENEERRF